MHSPAFLVPPTLTVPSTSALALTFISASAFTNTPASHPLPPFHIRISSYHNNHFLPTFHMNSTAKLSSSSFSPDGNIIHAQASTPNPDTAATHSPPVTSESTSSTNPRHSEAANTNKQTPQGLVRIKRALISVSDKTSLVELARYLHSLNIELISTGGSAATIRDKANVPVLDVSEFTQSPEMLGGRVKTLHPKIHGGLLAVRSDPEHMKEVSEGGLQFIDLVVANLYPFEEAVSKNPAMKDDIEACVELMDVGGPTMLRAAAKNYRSVVAISDVRQYPQLIAELTEYNGATTLPLRQKFASAVFARTASYDAAIASWFAQSLLKEDFPDYLNVGAIAEKRSLRYGENPHQSATFYVQQGPDVRIGVATAEVIQGKTLSYNNIADTDAAFELVSEFDEPACCIIKHANPCGVAIALSPHDAYLKALACDPVSAFGGIVAFNRTIDKDTAQELNKLFLEVVIAPDAASNALAILAAKKNLRVLLTGKMPDPRQATPTLKSVSGGFLLQNRDNAIVAQDDLVCVTETKPTDAQVRDLLFAWKVCKHVKSNAIVYAKNGATVGIGAGQMSRVDSARIAAEKAYEIARQSSIPSTLTTATTTTTTATAATTTTATTTTITPGPDATVDNGPGDAPQKITTNSNDSTNSDALPNANATDLADMPNPLAGTVVASDAFFPFPDGLLTCIEAGAVAVIQPGGSKKDPDVIKAANEKGAAMVLTGVRHFKH